MPQPTDSHGRLKGFRAIVTGAGSLGDGIGTGKAIATLFAAEGARVALVDMDASRARANTVVPGHIFTPMVEAYVAGEKRRVRREIAPLGIEGDAWDVAQAALFLAGPESRFITGVALPVDGGATQILPLAAYERLHET